jgi:Fe-S-cluster containining protein
MIKRSGLEPGNRPGRSKMKSFHSEVLRPLAGDTFTFACHPEVPCFTQCCRDLKLILTPYDILRLKNHLAVTSQAFLKTYTRTEFQNPASLPIVLLKMTEDEQKRCPFVTKEGCSVYEARPGACRTYPLGRAALKLRGQKEAKEHYFMVREDHCRGFEQGQLWTVEEWLRHEGLHEYNYYNDLWVEIMAGSHPVSIKDLDETKRAMFFLASYNLDEFRRFIFESSFLQRFLVAPEEIASFRSNDCALMLFAIKWINFFLFGETSLKIQEKRRA